MIETGRGTARLAGPREPSRFARVPYDDFADIYDVWCDSAPVTHRNRVFYVSKMLSHSGPVVELGVGNGRIAVEIAKRGRSVIGVDSSIELLRMCERRAKLEGVNDRVHLIQADFKDFRLPVPAALVTIPFHAIGHLLTDDDKRTALRNIRSQLRPTGRLIFDHFIYDPKYPRQDGVARLRAQYTVQESGRDGLMWETVVSDAAQQLLRLVIWTDEIDSLGVVVSRRYRRMNLTWLRPEQCRALLEETGFQVESLHGDFDESPLTGSSPQQIWVARRA